jgi:hypothetical protein
VDYVPPPGTPPPPPIRIEHPLRGTSASGTGDPKPTNRHTRNASLKRSVPKEREQQGR